MNGRHHAEGDYQCSAVVRGVRISNGQHVDTRLVSAPVKFRRARITKFEKVIPEVSTVFFLNHFRYVLLHMKLPLISYLHSLVLLDK